MRQFSVSIQSFLLLVAMAASGFSQTSNGTITGVVTSPAKTPIPGVTVRAQNVQTGSRIESVTNDAGVYQIETAAGEYVLEAELPGFQKITKSAVSVQASQVLSLALPLQVAGTQGGALARGAGTPARHDEITVTARRVEEEAQDVPIPLSVLSGAVVERTGAFNVNRLKELIPTVQLYSSNPRNTAVTIRGLGAPFGLTNDGIEPGVGFYVDGVYYARPAATTLDFLDIEQIEVSRGPQGTLFGKNTTSGNISITTRRPTFTPETNLELNYGNYGFVQAKGSFSGPLSSKLAVRGIC